MGTYLLRRLILLPITLFAILLVNFVIINLAPGEPTSITEISAESGAARREGQSGALGGDMRYLQFREHYGLTLPILFNTWPFISFEQTVDRLQVLLSRHLPGSDVEISLKEYDRRRTELGDQARFIMPHLLQVVLNREVPVKLRALAARFFIRGGTGQAYVAPQLSEEQKRFNRKVAEDNLLLLRQLIVPEDSLEVINQKAAVLEKWYQQNVNYYHYEPSFKEKIYIVFFETRFFRYMSRVVTLDFGTLRNDSNKTVVQEVTKRFKYSLTLSIIPLVMTLVLCQVFGFWMAYRQNGWTDRGLNLLFLILYAIPVFVVAPFLIEKIALYHTFPFTDTPIPISGFTSPEDVYRNMTSEGRLRDVLSHLMLPIVAIMYGGLAAQTRLSRTAVLEVMRQDYVRTAKAKGLSTFEIMTRHVGRNAGITIVTSVAGSFGVVLGGSLIVETLFDIQGFGKFFYDGVINRDYNVILFSALASSFLTLIGFLVGDLLYMFLDPRVSLE